MLLEAALACAVCPSGACWTPCADSALHRGLDSNRVRSVSLAGCQQDGSEANSREGVLPRAGLDHC